MEHVPIVIHPGENGEPMHFRTPAFESPKYSVACYPAMTPDGVVENWTLSQLDELGFKARLLEILPEEPRLRRALFAPTVNTMSGITLPQEKFTIIFPLDRWYSVRRPGYTCNSNERIRCDGTNIEPSNGFIMSPAGCLLLVLSGKTVHGEELCLVAHAGHNSLLDMSFISRGERSRPLFSVLDGLVAYAKAMGARAEDLILRSFFALPWQAHPHTFDDPKFGSDNEKLFAYLEETIGTNGIFLTRHDGVQCMSLSNLTKRQAEALHIGTIDTGLLSLPEDGAFAYTRHNNPALAGSVRNVVVLLRP